MNFNTHIQTLLDHKHLQFSSNEIEFRYLFTPIEFSALLKRVQATYGDAQAHEIDCKKEIFKHNEDLVRVHNGRCEVKKERHSIRLDDKCKLVFSSELNLDGITTPDKLYSYKHILTRTYTRTRWMLASNVTLDASYVIENHPKAPVQTSPLAVELTELNLSTAKSAIDNLFTVERFEFEVEIGHQNDPEDWLRVANVLAQLYQTCIQPTLDQALNTILPVLPPSRKGSQPAELARSTLLEGPWSYSTVSYKLDGERCTLFCRNDELFVRFRNMYVVKLGECPGVDFALDAEWLAHAHPQRPLHEQDLRFHVFDSLEPYQDPQLRYAHAANLVQTRYALVSWCKLKPNWPFNTREELAVAVQQAAAATKFIPCDGLIFNLDTTTFKLKPIKTIDVLFIHKQFYLNPSYPSIKGRLLSCVLEDVFRHYNAELMLLKRQSMFDRVLECSVDLADEGVRVTFEKLRVDKGPNDANATKTYDSTISALRELPRVVQALQSHGIELLKAHHNRIKMDVIAETEGGAYVVDVGSGRGGDLSKYDSQQEIAHTYMIEPELERFNEMKRREANMDLRSSYTFINSSIEKCTPHSFSRRHAHEVNMLFCVNMMTPKVLEDALKLFRSIKASPIRVLFMDCSRLQNTKSATYSVRWDSSGKTYLLHIEGSIVTEQIESAWTQASLNDAFLNFGYKPDTLTNPFNHKFYGTTDEQELNSHYRYARYRIF